MMDMESGAPPAPPPERRPPKSHRAALLLAYQSFGVVYGDLCISPIYVYKSTFAGELRLQEDDDEILGVLSLVFWTITLVALLKYVVILLEADDNGEGGTFALYSLLCRNANMGCLNNSATARKSISAYKTETSRRETRTSSLIKKIFEKHKSSRVVLLLVVLLGSSMLVGDGVLTPTMSVLSAVSGIKVKLPELNENVIVSISCFILMGLFALQHYGTHRLAFLFAPILIAWLCSISGVGIYNIVKWNPGVYCALSPYYIYNFFKKTGKHGWSSLGGIILCITGAEALFADLGHFSKHSIRIAFIGIVYPCLVLAYMGEAAYLSKHRHDIQRSFYKAVPESIFWPFFVIATLATIVGSQAIISATFSLISQCRSLGCFPRVKIIHTSNHVHGQIYIPEVNWILMFFCLAVTIGFRDTDLIGNAYGLAVVIVMFVTTCLMFLIITTVWKRTVFAAFLFALCFGTLELVYFSACLAKIHHGGWLPLTISLITLSAMSTWHYGTTKKRAYEYENKICLERLLSIGPGLGLVRVPGVGFIYSNINSGVPPMFAHFVTNFPAFHRIVIFISLQTLTVPKVLPNERFLIGRIGPQEQRLFRCIVRYGYKDGGWDSYDFENQLLMKVAEFLQQEGSSPTGAGPGPGPGPTSEMSVIGKPSDLVVDAVAGPDGTETKKTKKVRFVGADVREEVRELVDQRESGVAYMMGHTCVVASESSSFTKKVLINVIYGFLRRNSRRPSVELGIPHTSLIEVGMVYHV